MPARLLDYDLVLNYRIDQLGVHGESNGLLQVEGRWYCPAMPKTLVSATLDYREDRIDKVTYDKRIDARSAHEARPNGKPDAEVTKDSAARRHKGLQPHAAYSSQDGQPQPDAAEADQTQQRAQGPTSQVLHAGVGHHPASRRCQVRAVAGPRHPAALGRLCGAAQLSRGY